MSSLYYKSRADAGKKLVPELDKYRNQNAVVIALSEGAAVVGAQVAINIHTNLLLYLIKSIYLPGEHDAIAALSSTDTFMYNNAFSAGELEEMTMEYRTFIEQERMKQRHEINLVLGHEGEINKQLLRHKIVIMISDGLSSGFSIDLAAEYLKTIAISKLVIATPIASVEAVDRMHLVADEIVCLAVADNFMGTDHYYEDNTVPDMRGILKIMNNIALTWKH